MKQTIKIVGTLTLACAICSFFLALVYSSAKDKIEENQKQRFNQAIAILAPETATIERMPLGEDIIYKLFDAKHSLIGYAFLAVGEGYQDKINMLVTIDPQLEKIEGVSVLESSETPGLGAKIQEPEFLRQFANKKISKPLQCVKTEPKATQDIKAITGATVSSSSVVKILNKRISQIREKINYLKK